MYARTMVDDVELLIAGGGLNGMALAIACAAAGLSVMLVDRQDLSAMLDDGFDGRTSAIAYGSKLILDGIGVWPELAGEAEPIREIRVADDDSPLFLHYDHRELGEAVPLGYIVENRVLRRVLLDRARRLAGLRLVSPQAVAQAAPARGGMVAALGGGETVRARLVAAVDGTVAHERPQAGIAGGHFRPAGPFASLPMTGNRSSIVWTEAKDLAPRLLALPGAEFAAELAARFGDFLGALEPVGPRWTYPLALMQAESYIAPRLALVGEAAHVINAIAGQAVNLGLRDVAALAELIVDARRLGLDIGAPEVLTEYQRWRRADAVVLAAVTDGLNRLFSTTLPAVKLVRGLGLAAVNRLPPLKRLLMRHAMGMLGDRPRLARGEAL